MEKISERFGLFDFWVVFFPGILGMIELLFFMGVFWSIYKTYSILIVIKGILPSSMPEWIVTVVISFFMGMVLQETGRYMRKVTNFQSATEGLLNPKDGVFTKKEIVFFGNLFKCFGWDGESLDMSNLVFHRINAEAQECGVAIRYVKLNVLQNMALSLSATMALGTIVSILLLIFGLINGRGHIAVLLAIIVIINSLLMRVFFKRYKRFNRYWVRSLVYAIHAKNNEVEKKQNGDAKEN